MRALNRRFRGMDRVTDVLSFPMGPAPADHSGGRVGDAQLGDVVIALGRAERQARAMGHARLTELKVLALHGVLHLLGHDHETDDGAMSRAERRCLRRGGLAHGLLGRSDVVPVVSPPRRTGRGARRGT
jgi:probable rRNA maturation factor